MGFNSLKMSGRKFKLNIFVYDKFCVANSPLLAFVTPIFWSSAFYGQIVQISARQMGDCETTNFWIITANIILLHNTLTHITLPNKQMQCMFWEKKLRKYSLNVCIRSGFPTGSASSKSTLLLAEVDAELEWSTISSKLFVWREKKNDQQPHQCRSQANIFHFVSSSRVRNQWSQQKKKGTRNKRKQIIFFFMTKVHIRRAKSRKVLE